MKRALLISVCAWPVVGLLLAPAARGEPYHWIAVDDYWDEGENWSDQYGNPRPGEYHQDDEMYVDKDADKV
jgi:hypothetical protein